MIPRRIPDYADAFEGWNYVSSIGSLISVAATALFLYVMYDMLSSQPVTVGNSWAQTSYFVDSPSFEQGTQYSNTLEWVLPAPTPLHSYSMIPAQS